MTTLEKLVCDERNKSKKFDVWAMKTNSMVNKFKEEVERFLSWTLLINEIPKELKDGKEEVRNLFDTILEKLTNHVSLKTYQKSMVK